MGIAKEIGRSVVLTDFLTDKHGVIAKATQQGHFEIPAELKNSSDWGRYQFDDPASVQTILLGGKKISELKEFHLVHEFIQEMWLLRMHHLYPSHFLGTIGKTLRVKRIRYTSLIINNIWRPAD